MLRIVSLTGSQVLIIGLFSHTDTHTFTSTRTHTHTHTHTQRKAHRNSTEVHTFSNCLNPVKKGYKSLFFFYLQSLFKLLLYNMCPLHDTTLLMTMSSCLSPGSNLELRRRQSALVFGRDRVHRLPTGRSVTSSLPDR